MVSCFEWLLFIAHAYIGHRERQTWRCAHCLVHGSAVWAVRDGPNGPRVRRPAQLWKTVTNNRSPCATIVALLMNEINGCHLGARVYISKTFLLGYDSIVSLFFS